MGFLAEAKIKIGGGFRPKKPSSVRETFGDPRRSVLFGYKRKPIKIKKRKRR